MTAEHIDVLIVGAGLSGIGAGCHLRRSAPDRSFTILEARGSLGGTWDLFRYPGIRSDSDMHTLGYSFAPWKEAQAIADGPSILDYVARTATEYGVDREIRFHHRVLNAAWDSAESAWTVDVQRSDTGQTLSLTCSFLLMCTGYYRYDGGYMPAFEGVDSYRGTLVHPQHWPEDLDYSGRRVVVIGSGATAITLVPALARDAAHVTMLQRSPSYVVSLPGRDPLAALAQRRLPEMAAYRAVRCKNVVLMALTYQLSRWRPRMVKAVIRRGVRSQLPPGFDVDTHFAPRYDPWDQRLCICPDGDLFRAVRDGSASVVTDRIQRFTEAGVLLAGGRELEADIIVSATGLRLQALGGATLSVDGCEVELPDRMVYRGMMLSGVPNLALTVGYSNASWTLKADLTLDYVCRLLNHMRDHGYRECRPADSPPGLTREPLIGLQSGYVLRSLQEFPSQGSKRPWKLRQNYPLDVLDFHRSDIEDGVMQFSAGALTRAAVPIIA